MANVKTIEGKTENSGFSDLNLGIGYAGQHSKTATLCFLAKGRMARSGEMHGLLACEELQSLPHCTRNLGNPYVEKEARLRPQPHFTFGGGEDQTAKSKASKAGGLMKLRHPASNLFYE